MGKIIIHSDKNIKLINKELIKNNTKKCFICEKKVSIYKLDKHLTLGNSDTCEIIKKCNYSIITRNYSFFKEEFE